MAPEKILRNFAWLRTRNDGFNHGFTRQQIVSEMRRITSKPTATHRRVSVPKPLRKLIREAREVVYLRTLRSDAVFHMLYEARPILHEAATSFGISFSELARYSIHDLINGKPIRHSTVFFATKGDSFSFFNSPLITAAQRATSLVKGTIAYRGIIRGRVRIVRNVQDSERVQAGDILIAPMTMPSFIMAMQRAAAFVTDEGGLTCHAAIVARELKKPCVVGTKHATRVFKDGDRVEVDANKGVVRKA